MHIECTEEKCSDNLRKINLFENWIVSENYMKGFLDILKHSLVCNEFECEEICRFINDVFLHTYLSPYNNCHMKKVYYNWERLHVKNCIKRCKVASCKYIKDTIRTRA